MSNRPLAATGLALALGAAALSACAPTTGGGLPYAAPAAFNERDFGWSQMPGRNSIEGQIAFAQDGKTFACVGSAGLTPDTPYTRARIRTLYGSTQRAAVPAAVVRARTVADANSDYRTYVRDTRCENGRFRFDGLPDGGWFLIVPVTSGDAPVVLMQSVQTRGGRVVSITL